MNYTYTRKNVITKKNKNKIIIGISKHRNVSIVIKYSMLRYKRESKFHKLFLKFDGNFEDIDSVRKYLPIRYKQYAHDLRLLKAKLYTFKNISIKYRIRDIKLGPMCQGCLYNSSGQRNHMESPYGCLL